MSFKLADIQNFMLNKERQMLLSRIKMKGLLSLPNAPKKSIFYGNRHYCPVCDSAIRQFETFGHLADAWCPVCAAMRWQRFGWLVLQRYTHLFAGTPLKLLHIAPEVAFEPRLKQLEHLDYVTGDLFDPKVMVKMDVCDIPFPDETFDAIYCSHVMEHIPDDKKALSEFFRVLKASGWAIFMVPIRMERLTDEDLSVTDPKEREKRFGQFDHVRQYGKDFEDRLRSAGFLLQTLCAGELLEEEECDRMGIRKKEVAFFCKKASS